MKLKFISRLLVSSILASTLNASSFANSWSEDGRYETFNENNITVNNVLEDGNTDLNIEGNTLINMFKDISLVIDNGIVYSTYSNNKLTYQPKDTYTGSISYANIASISTNKSFVGGKTYTMYFDCNLSGVNFGLKGVNSMYHHVGADYMTTTSIGRNKFTFKLEDDISLVDHYQIRIYETNTREQHVFENIVIVEGEAPYESLEYFYDMKSGFENTLVTQEMIDSGKENKNNLDKYKVDVLSTGKNKAKPSYLKNTTEYEPNLAQDARYATEEFYPVKGSTWYTFSTKNETPTKYILYLDADFKCIEFVGNHGPNKTCSKFSPENARYAQLYVYDTFNPIDRSNEMVTNEWMFEEGATASEFEEYKSDIKTIYLNEPLRSLPDGTKDRIIKKDGRWVVERNCGEAIFDGSGDESWYYYETITPVNNTLFYINNPGIVYINNNENIISNNLPSKYMYYEDVEGIFHNHHPLILIRVSNSKLNTVDVAGLRSWLSKNPLKVVYQLATPIYEPLNIKPDINLFEDTTYISNNSTIPANMKVVVDRAPNRAKEAIEVAKLNPTAANISQARFWTNLLKDSTLKDDFQEQINTNTDVVDLTIEKKKTSANVDVYVKMKNTLSLSLDTNSITFEDFNASEDMEKKNVVNLIVSSSLPYKVNASLESEIYNSDKTATIDRSVLNIKVNNENEYKAFEGIDTALLLLDNQVEGNNIAHGLDFILRGGSTHQADVYKATIKFEVEQK